MLQQLITSIRELKWRNAALELVVVALGILMAFQVDRWWESRDDRISEQTFINRLVLDIDADINELTYAVELAALRLSFANLLMDIAENPELAQDSPIDFIIAINQAAFTYTPALTSNTFDELKLTGSLGLLLNTDLRDSLFEYYRFDETQRQYLQLNFMQEFRHFELGAGVLTNKQLRRAQVDWDVVSPVEIIQLRNEVTEEAEILAAANRLATNTQFIAWLPIAQSMQLDHIRINGDRKNKATNLLSILRASLSH